jgi:soluble lytic murein transglycosylase-like protein
MKNNTLNNLFRIAGLILWFTAASANLSIFATQTDLPGIAYTLLALRSPSPKPASPPLPLKQVNKLRIISPSIPELPPNQNESSIVFYNQIIDRAAVIYNIDPDLIRAVIMVESRYKPKAASNKKAQGLMQIIPSTGKELGIRNVFDPEENILAGTKYIRHLLDRFDGDLDLTLAAYNSGYRKVRQHKGIPPYKATRAYVENVFKYYTFYKMESFELGRIRID